MNCEAVRELLWAYLEKETTAEEAAKIEEHLAECADCREELEAQKAIMETLAGLPDEELPEGYHEELMQKLRVEAAPNVVPFPQKKKKQPMWKQWGMIAAAVLVVVAAGGMDGMLEMRESQNAAMQEMKAADTGAPVEASIEDTVKEEGAEDITAELQKDGSVAYSSKKMSTPAAGVEAAEVTTQGRELMDSVEMSAYGVDDAAAVPKMASAKEMTASYGLRSMTAEATDQATLLAEDQAAAMAAVQKAIAEAGGFEEAAGAENSILAAIPVENYDAFVKAVENIGTLEWTMQGAAEEGAAYRTVELQLKTK